MRLERRALTGDPRALATELRALVPAPDGVQQTAAEIIADVRKRGDLAVHEYTQRFDAGGEEVSDKVAPEVLTALEEAASNVEQVAAGALDEERTVAFAAHRVTTRGIPVARAAVYAPGGRHPY